MATEALKSTSITNDTATPGVLNNGVVTGGVIRSAAEVIEWTTGMTLGSTYRYFRVPSNARVHSLNLFCDAFTTTGAADIGLYNVDGGTVVDADLFASAQLLTTALNGTDVTHESVSNPIDNADEMIWQRLALTSDPGLEYDVVMTSTATNGSAGTVALKMLYSI